MFGVSPAEWEGGLSLGATAPDAGGPSFSMVKRFPQGAHATSYMPVVEISAGLN